MVEIIASCSLEYINTSIMFDPYRMVVVNVIASALILAVTIFYKVIYPKKKINLFVLLLIISVLPIISIFRIGDYESGDFNIHVYRTISFFQNLTEGNLMPSWAGALNGTYGYPLFIFLNPLPYYLISFFHFLGFSFIVSLKLFLAFAYILSGVFMYLFIKQTLKNDLAAFTSSVFYLFTPYHLIDLHFRNDVGEVLSFTLIPVLLLFIYKLFHKDKIIYLLWCGLIFSLLILAHQAIAILSLAIIIPFTISLFHQHKKRLKQFSVLVKLLLAFILGIVMSGYAWAPYFSYAKYTLSSILFKQLPGFIEVSDILYSPWRFRLLFQGPEGQLSFLIGYAQLFILFYLLGYLLLNKINAKYKTDIIIWVLTIAILIFMLFKYSEIIWLTVPIIKNMLMSSRILLIITFCISYVAAYLVLMNTNKKILIYLVLVFAIGSTMLNWGHRRVIPEITDSNLLLNLPKSTYEGEGLYFIGNTIWFSNKPVWINKVPSNKIESIQGKVQIKVLKNSSTEHTYTLFSKEGARVLENTLYFPGWNVIINGKRTKINYEDSKYRGLITFNIPKGTSYVSVIYKDLFLLQFLKLIFILFVGITLVYTLLHEILFKRVLKKSRK
nr:glycosyltransferase family 39 protein [Candidatus Levybacteria bacterium]